MYVTTNTTMASDPMAQTCHNPRQFGCCSDADRAADEQIRMLAEEVEHLRRLLGQEPMDRTAGCPCRPENGGSGICGCVLGGPQITC